MLISENLTENTSSLIPPEPMAQAPVPVVAGLRGIRGGIAPIVGDIVHIVSDDGICCAGMVTLTFAERPTDALITLFVPTAGAGPVCIGLVKYGPDQKARTWHDPQKCRGERQPSKVKRLIGG